MGSAREDDAVLAKLAVQHGFLTEQQVRDALSFQREREESGTPPPLRQVLLDRGWISRRQLDALQLAADFLSLRKPDRLFGRLAVSRGLVTREQADAASQMQARIYKETRVFRSLGDLLVEQGWLKAGVRDALLARMKSPELPSASSPAPPSKPAPAAPSAPAPTPPDATGSGPPGPASAQPKGRAQIRIESETLPDDTHILLEEESFDLLVSEDKLRAYLRIKASLSEGHGVELLTHALEAQGIVYGLLDPLELEALLQQPPSRKQVWRIARGTDPQPGKDAEIRYCFPTRPKTLAPLEGEGKVDFKDLGEIPRVKKGDLLAEKTPRVPETPGTDVFGNEIAVPKSKELTLLCGSGTEISPDRRRVTARVDGLPQLSLLGRLSVLPELVIPGDVSFETGNIEYEGKITVHGVVQDGFRVKGSALIAREIGKAQIDVSGDVVVYGGILGAKVRSQGNVNAVHIYDSQIEAMGNVVVDKGVVDSKISISGKLTCLRGAVVSSRITARRGIEAAQVGLERSAPSVLVIGIDPLAEREIDRLKESLARHEAERAGHASLVRPLRERDAVIEARIGELAQVQDRTGLELRQVQSEIRELRERKDTAQLAQAEEYLKEIEAVIGSAARELDALFEEQDEIRGKLARHKEQLRGMDQAIRDLRDELTALTEWNSAAGRPPSVQVQGLVCSGTTVKGVFSSMVFKTDARFIQIREGRVGDTTSETPGKSSEMKLFVTSLARSR